MPSEISIKRINEEGKEIVLYEPETDPRCDQLAFHTSNSPNLLALGTRGTGKSTVLRWDAIMRCLTFPGFRALILRRKMPELQTSHLHFIEEEMFKLGGEKNGFRYLSTIKEAIFPNGSVLKFSHCYDDQTEVLTQRGFVRFPELRDDDDVASLNEETKEMRFERPLERQKRRFQGGAVRINTQQIDLLVTPDHPMLCWNHEDKPVVFPASEATLRPYGRKPLHFWRTATWAGQEQAYFDPIPDLTVSMDDWLYFLGWFLSEGHTSKSRIRGQWDAYSVSLAQKKDPDVIRRVAEMWTAWGLKSSSLVRADGVEVLRGASPLYAPLSVFGKSDDKHVPDYVKALSPRQIRIFLDALFKGDGTIVDGKWSVYTTTSKRLADDVQELLLRIGMVGTCGMRQTTPTHKKPVYYVTVSHTRIQPTFRPDTVTTEPYDGYMYDVTMPNSPTLLVRRNGRIVWGHNCEKMADVMNYLSSEWGFIGFDELSTFPLEMFLPITAAARARADAPYKAVVRAGSNTLGIGSAWMRQWFGDPLHGIEKHVDHAEYPDYYPDDWEVQYSWMDGNSHINQTEYVKRLKSMPEHVRKSWLELEFITEGAYFSEFRKNTVAEDGTKTPWHCIQTMPTWQHGASKVNVLDIPWIKVTRSVDWGFHPDPAVCHWHIVMPNGRKITFKEATWKRTVAKDVALEIKRMSAGMHVIQTDCDPKMFTKDGQSPFSIADIFEQNGVPLTPAQNDRELFGYVVHEMLSTVIEDNGRQYPSWQILEHACPELVRTLPILQMDAGNPQKIADGPDHWVISCAYFGMSLAPASKDPVMSTVPRWMQGRPSARRW